MKTRSAFDMCKLCTAMMTGGINQLTATLLNRVFVDGRGRAEIMGDMESRIKLGDMEREKAAAIKVSFP